MTIRIQYASGIARALKENCGRYNDLIKPAAPYLALCGNIVSPHNKKVAAPFFEWVTANYEKVWWVPGREEVATFGAGQKQGVTDNLTAMYEFVKNGPYENIHIANKLTKSYAEGFTIVGISQPSYKERNIEHVFHSTGKSYSMNDLSAIYEKDKEWIERQLLCPKREPVVVLTNGYLQTEYFYNANLVGDTRRNFTGHNSTRHKKSWVGSNNWEVSGYKPAKFIELV